jgi:hypothetical protein
MPPTVAATGRTILGNLTCLMIRSREVTDMMPSFTADENHFHGRIAENTNSGYASLLILKITVTSTT